MPIHNCIDRFKLLDEIKLLEDGGHKIKFILPELIEHKPGNQFGLIIQYLIIFEENE